MILHSLAGYYERKNAHTHSALAPIGFQEKKIPFVILIKADGEYLQLRDTREESGKKDKGRSFLVPQGAQRSGQKSYETAYCLWDHSGYVVNQPKLDKPGAIPTEKNIQAAANQHASFRREVERLAKALPEDKGVQAVKNFYSRPEQIEAIKNDPVYQECLKIPGCNMAFQLAEGGETNALCCQSSQVQEYVRKRATTSEDKGPPQVCLVSGRKEPAARLHQGIGQIVGKPVPLASINISSAESYGKEQGYNFPVGEQAAFEYTTALNHLLRPESDQKLYLAGTTLVCWAQKQHQLEKDLPRMFRGTNQDDPDQGTARVTQRYKSLATGLEMTPDSQQPFYVLGLAPNPPARIVIRFWMTGTVAEFSQRIGQWFRDLELDGSQYATPPSIYQLLRCTALQNKSDNLPPNLAAEVYLAIMEGLPLPATLQAGVIRRIRAEKGKVTHTRACLIKAGLNRKYRYGEQSSQEEITVSLNKNEKQPGYLLGRLFAVLEKLQKDASKGTLNSTICDRYYSSASCTPKVVFGTLMRLSTHHMKKLEKPEYRAVAEKNIQKIVDLLDSETGFPAHLNLHEQGLFAIGYYHQKQALYQKKTTQEPQDGSSDASCA